MIVEITGLQLLQTSQDNLYLQPSLPLQTAKYNNLIKSYNITETLFVLSSPNLNLNQLFLYSSICINLS